MGVLQLASAMQPTTGFSCRSQTTFAFSIGDHYNVSFISYISWWDLLLTISQHIYPQKTEVLWECCEILITQAPTNFFPTLHPSISAWTTHGLPLIASPSKMTTVLIRRNAQTDSCHNLTALLPHCTKHHFYAHQTTYVLTKIQTTCIMLFLWSLG